MSVRLEWKTGNWTRQILWLVARFDDRVEIFGGLSVVVKRWVLWLKSVFRTPSHSHSHSLPPSSAGGAGGASGAASDQWEDGWLITSSGWLIYIIVCDHSSQGHVINWIWQHFDKWSSFECCVFHKHCLFARNLSCPVVFGPWLLIYESQFKPPDCQT